MSFIERRCPPPPVSIGDYRPVEERSTSATYAEDGEAGVIVDFENHDSLNAFDFIGWWNA